MPSLFDKHELLISVLSILNKSGIEEKAVRKILKIIRVQTSIDAAAIRLKSGEDYPYYASDGLNPSFIKKETNLVSRSSLKKENDINCNNSALDCICGLVIRGKKVKGISGFSSKGSFWTNDTGSLAEDKVLKKSGLNIRNTCSRSGFESIALIPLHDGTSIIGLLQLNSRIKNKFSPDLIGFFESLGTLMGIALTQKINEKKIKSTNRDLEQMVEERTLEYLKALKSKETIVQEMHHRIKNNLTTISSLLALQAMKLKNPGARDHLLNAVMRVKSMGIIHNKLYKYDDLENIDLKKYLVFLIEEIRNVFSIHKNKIIFNIKCDDIILNIDTAIPCGLIINEIIINSIKHAFPDVKKGIIDIAIKQEKEWYFIYISDNGIGLSEEFEKDRNSNLGMDIIWNLVKQLDGSVNMISDNGLKYSIILKREIKEEDRWTKKKY